MKLNKKFCIVTSFYNQEHRIIRSIEHSLAQKFESLGLIIYSDGSTDTSHTKILSYFPSLELVEGYTDLWHTESNGVEVLYKKSAVRNTSASYNIQQMVKHHIENDDCVIGIVDGDDYLEKTDACATHWNAYKIFPIAPVIVSSIACETEIKGVKRRLLNAHSGKLTDSDEFQAFGNKRRAGVFCFQTHFKTFMKRVSDLVPREYFEDDEGNLMGPAADVAYFNTMMEIVDDMDRFVEVGPTGYVYTSECFRRDCYKTDERIKNGAAIKAKPIHPYIYVPKADWQEGHCEDVEKSALKAQWEEEKRLFNEEHNPAVKGPTGNPDDLYDEKITKDKQWLKDELGIED